MEACLQEQLPPATELEENLRNGVYLAKLCHFVAPDILPLNKIYDIDQKRYNVAGLQFRHTDNINHFLTCLKKMDLPIVNKNSLFYNFKSFAFKQLNFEFNKICLPLSDVHARNNRHLR